MLPTIKIGYSDAPFLNEENLFFEILSKHFNVTEDVNDLDLLISSLFGNKYKNIKSKQRLLFIGENFVNHCGFDYYVGFQYNNDDNYLRFPLWKFYLHLENRRRYIDDLVDKKINYDKSRFCSFVVSSMTGKFRNNFFRDLKIYKPIDSFGSFYNNNNAIIRTKGESSYSWQKKKISVLRDLNFKFMLCMENSSSPGYCTEKLPDAMLTGALPIYYGDENVGRDFNEESFIVVTEDNLNESIDYIEYLDNNDAAYYDKLSKPWLTDEQKTRILNNELEDFLLKILK